MHVAADLAVLGFAAVEHQPVARLDRPGQAHPDAAFAHRADGADAEATVPRVATQHQFLVARSEQEAGCQAVCRRILAARERLELFVEVCQAVQHAHQKGIIHRDLKPSNILVTLADGEPVVKVIDFGIAKAADRISSTEAGELKGKFAYMSPEQIRGDEIDHRSDIYALGLILYELCTGRKAFEATTR